MTYGPNGVEYQAESCFHNEPHIQLQCVTSPSTGSHHKWIVTVGRQKSIVPTTSVNPPTIVKMTGIKLHNISTTGGEKVTIIGKSFGEDLSLIKVRYRNEFGVVYQANDCSFLENHVSVICETVEGYGKELSWQIVVDDQDSGWTSIHTSYADPVLNYVSPITIPTANSVLTLYGDNIGPQGVSSVVIGGFSVAPSSLIHVSHNKIEVSIQEVNDFFFLVVIKED